MAITDVPDAPLSTGRDAALTDRLATGSLSCHVRLDRFHGGKDGRIGLAFLNDEPVANLVAVLQVGRKVVCHVAIVGPSGERGTVFSPVRESTIGDRLRRCSVHHQERQLVAALDLVG